jgi:hypothetical protein
VKKDGSRQRIVLNRLTPLDMAIIIFIILLAVAIILRTKLNLNQQSSKAIEATVYHDGKIHQHLALDEDRELSLLSGKMLIQIEGKKLRVKKSECPRQLCVNIGWIQHTGEAVICVPYKTMIEIKSPSAPVVDAVVY